MPRQVKLFQYSIAFSYSFLIRFLFGCYSVVIRYHGPNNKHNKAAGWPLLIQSKQPAH